MYNEILKKEFELRIFISMGIAAAVAVCSFTIFNNVKSLYQIISEGLGIDRLYFFLFGSIGMLFASFLRVWAGSILSSGRVMSFKVVSNCIMYDGPYQLTRNPIYFSDWFAMCIFSLFLPGAGILLPILFYIHYIQLIRYEEQSFLINKDNQFSDYLNNVPRLIPSFKSTVHCIKESRTIFINKDGIRHNALYFLFIPGFIAGYYADNFLLTVLIGIPMVIDWAIVHTIIGKVKKNKVFDDILYAQCWEDPQIDRTAFDIKENDTVFTITSGGCNTLTFLIDNPEKIIALDLSKYQNYLLELKIAAFKLLTHKEMLQFIGVNESSERELFYLKMKKYLTAEAAEYWDSNSDKIIKGVLHCGRFEKYMKLLRTGLNFVIGKSTIKKFYAASSQEEVNWLYDNKWNNLRWKFFTKVFLSHRIMRFLFDEAFFKYLSGEISFGANFRNKVEKAFKSPDFKRNYFLRYILLGNYDEAYLPPYLQQENYNKIRSRVNRIKIITASCQEYFKSLPTGSIDKFNFTNIFEWISETEFHELLKETKRVSKDHSVITYRNLLVLREHPVSMDDIISSDHKLSESLHNRDLSFIYDRYIVEYI